MSCSPSFMTARRKKSPNTEDDLQWSVAKVCGRALCVTVDCRSRRRRMPEPLVGMNQSNNSGNTPNRCLSPDRRESLNSAAEAQTVRYKRERCRADKYRTRGLQSTTAAPSPTTTKRSGSIRSTRTLSTIVGFHMTLWANMPAPSPILARRSGLMRNCRRPDRALR